MLKRILLLFIIGSIVVSTLAQKNKRKSSAKAPNNNYFEMIISGSSTDVGTFCPNDSITFDFVVLDTNIKIVKYCWYNTYNFINLCDITPIKLSFPIIAPFPNINIYPVKLFIEYKTGRRVYKSI